MFPDQPQHHPGRVIQHYSWKFPNRNRILLEKGIIWKRVYETAEKIGEVSKIHILFEVTDPTGEIRRITSSDDSPKAFPEFLKTMRNFSVYSDWKEMNAVQREAKAYGITEDDLSMTLKAMIRDTGIVR